jgi:hypothetical protein
VKWHSFADLPCIYETISEAKASKLRFNYVTSMPFRGNFNHSKIDYAELIYILRAIIIILSKSPIGDE